MPERPHGPNSLAKGGHKSTTRIHYMTRKFLRPKPRVIKATALYCIVIIRLDYSPTQSNLS